MLAQSVTRHNFRDSSDMKQCWPLASGPISVSLQARLLFIVTCLLHFCCSAVGIGGISPLFMQEKWAALSQHAVGVSPCCFFLRGCSPPAAIFFVNSSLRPSSLLHLSKESHHFSMCFLPCCCHSQSNCRQFELRFEWPLLQAVLNSRSRKKLLPPPPAQMDFKTPSGTVSHRATLLEISPALPSAHQLKLDTLPFVGKILESTYVY